MRKVIILLPVNCIISSITTFKPINLINYKFHRKLIKLVDKLLLSENLFLIRLYSLSRELLNYLLCLPSLILINPPDNKINFIIYSQGRTGSTLLVDLLNSHPLIHCDREVFFLKTLLPYNFLKSKSIIYGKQNYGCKIQGRQLQLQVGDSGIKPFIKTFNQYGWKIIYLKRRNILRHAISKLVYMEIGMQNRHQHTGEKKLNINQFRIDSKKLFEFMADIERVNEFDEEILREIPKITLTYEDHLLQPEKHQETMDKIFNFLGIESCVVRSDLDRITGKDLRSFITNYDEVASLISKSDYAKYIELDNS